MIWKHDADNDRYLTCKSNLIMVFGFTREKQNFDVVLTLHQEGSCTYANGFLSTVKLTIRDYAELFEYVKNIIQTEHILFEVVLPAAKLYRYVFKKLKYEIVSETPKKTFDGYDSILAKIKLKTNLE